MKYRGFDIVTVYHVGSDFIVNSNGVVKNRKPTRKDIAYYSITDPMENGRQYSGEDSIKEAKAEIDRLLDTVLHMKSNSKEEWDKLDE